MFLHAWCSEIQDEKNVLMIIAECEGFCVVCYVMLAAAKWQESKNVIFFIWFLYEEIKLSESPERSNASSLW